MGEAALPRQEAISRGKTKIIDLMPSFGARFAAMFPIALSAAIPLPIMIVIPKTRKLNTMIQSSTATFPILAKYPTMTSSPPKAFIPSANTLAAMIILTTETKISAIAFSTTTISSLTLLPSLWRINSIKKQKEIAIKFALTTSSLIPTKYVPNSSTIGSHGNKI